MARTPSHMVELGTPAPPFSLPDTNGHTVTFDQMKSDQATVVMFICNHCPFVIHVNEGLISLANDYIPRGVNFVAISSNDVENYPQDSPEKMKEVAEELGYPFPYLYDESQQVARAYNAACTPDFFIYDGHGRLAYRGQLDDSRPGNEKPVTGKDIRDCLDAMLEGRPAPEDQKPSLGCNIKWKA